MRLPWTARRERARAEAEVFRTLRRIAREHVTAFGEQHADLHVETLTADLGDGGRADYQQALEAYEEAKRRLAAVATADDLRAVGRTLTDGRFLHARVLARRDGLPLPQRREPCFFNPQHGPSVADVPWTPSGGVEREVPVCRSDQLRLAGGLLPAVRTVMVGDRLVPWWAAGEAGRSPMSRLRRPTTATQRHLEYVASVNANMTNFGGGNPC